MRRATVTDIAEPRPTFPAIAPPVSAWLPALAMFGVLVVRTAGYGT
jgi:hypothetical protein